MGWLSSTGRGGSRVGPGVRRGLHAEAADGRVHCRVCGMKTRTRMGDVCSRRQCQQEAALGMDSVGTKVRDPKTGKTVDKARAGK